MGCGALDGLHQMKQQWSARDTDAHDFQTPSEATRSKQRSRPMPLRGVPNIAGHVPRKLCSTCLRMDGQILDAIRAHKSEAGLGERIVDLSNYAAGLTAASYVTQASYLAGTQDLHKTLRIWQ